VVIDLSLGGCLVRSDAPLDAGAVLDLALEIGGGPLALKVRVAEVSVDGASFSEPRPRCLAGLEFLGLAATDEARLRSFLEAESRRRRGVRAAPR
jgi:hypothetical protein